MLIKSAENLVLGDYDLQVDQGETSVAAEEQETLMVS